jgi:hypothetical protein
MSAPERLTGPARFFPEPEQARLSCRPVLRAGRVHRAPLPVQEKSPRQGRADLHRPGSRDRCALLRQRRLAQRRGERRGAALCRLLEGGTRKAPGSSGVRLKAHHVQEPGALACAGDHLHHAAPPHRYRQTPRAERTGWRMAPRGAGHPAPQVSYPQGPR